MSYDDAIADVEEKDKEVTAMLAIDGDAIQSSVQKLLRLSSFEPTHRYWLDLKNEHANAVFGSREKGVPYGKVFEISGPEHCGKTLISNVLMGLAQQDGAAAGYIDLEDSRDGIWSTKLGVNWAAVTKFYYELVMAPWRCKCGTTNPGSLESQICSKCKKARKGPTPPPTLLSAEQIFEQAESAMYKLSKLGAHKQFWFLDSIAMIVTAKQYEVGLADSSMNSKLDRAMFLSTLLPRWSGIAANYNAMILVSNQLRSKVGTFTGYGDPDETTGGKALRHVCSIRIRGRRVKGGRLKNGKQVVGLAGALRNIKNKAGDGSQEGCECGFKILWNKPKASVEFMAIDELNSEMGEDK
jgi:recombination protein RecA